MKAQLSSSGKWPEDELVVCPVGVGSSLHPLYIIYLSDCIPHHLNSSAVTIFTTPS